MDGHQAVEWAYKDQTLAQCLKSSWHFGSTTYYNLCNGQQQVVPWGGFDWCINISVFTFVVLFVLTFLIGFFLSTSDY